MKLKILALVAISTFFIGCKNEKATDTVTGEPQEQQPAADALFIVTLDVTVKKDDNLQVYYNTGNGFNEEEAIWAVVKGMPESQKVVFPLPKNVIPMSIRVDLGVKDDQEEVVFSGMEMQYAGRKFEAKGQELSKFFYPLPDTEIDFATGVVKVNKKDGKRIEPAFNANDENLGPEIAKITK